MKTFIFILFLCVVSSCAISQRYVFKKTYEATDSSLVFQDIYKQCEKYHVSQIPLYQWMANEISTDTINLVQKMIRQMPEKNKEYDFILTKFMYPKKTY